MMKRLVLALLLLVCMLPVCVLAQTYTVSFEANGGTGTMDAVPVEADAEFTLPACDFKAPANKVFHKWRVNGAGFDGVTLYPEDSVYVQGDMTLTAQWANEYSNVTYLYGEDTSVNPYVVEGLKYDTWYDLLTYEECGFTAPEGYVFGGWLLIETNPDGSTWIADEFPFGGSIHMSRSFTFMAKWIDEDTPLYTMSFELNGGKITVVDADGNDIVVSELEPSEAWENGWFDLPDPGYLIAPEGKEFSHWDVNGYRYAWGSVKAVQNVTAKAIWKTAGEPSTFTVYYDANGGTGEMDPVTVQYYDDEEKDTLFILPECTFDAPEGMEFGYWLLDGEVPRSVGEGFIPYQDTVVVAYWKKIPVGVYIHPGEFTGGQGGTFIEVEPGESYTFKTYEEYHLEMPEGKVFTNFFSGTHDIKIYPGDTLENITGYVDAGACWEDMPDNEPIVTYKAFDDPTSPCHFGFEEEDGWHTAAGDVFNAPEGKVFAGWMRASDGEVFSAGERFDLTEDMTLIAIWMKPSCTISFFANGGEGTMPSVTVKGNGSYMMPACRFEAPENMTFSHWYAEIDGEEVDLWPGDMLENVRDDVSFAANWRDNSPAVYLIPNDENESDPLKYVVNSGENFVLKHPNDYGIETPEGMFFWGWYDGDRDVDYIYEGEDILIENITEAIRLGAVWKKNNYTMTFTSEYDGETQIAEQTAPRGSAFYFEHPEDHGIETPEGMFIDCYYCVEHDEVYWVNDVIEPVHEDLEFIVNWRENSPNIFLWPNNDVEEGPVKVDVGAGNTHELKHPTEYGITAPEDKVFWGWYDGDLERDYMIDDVVEIDDSAVYLGAVWKDKHVTMTFHANNGTGETDEVPCEYGDIFIVPGNGGDDDLISFEAPQGMTFDYWYVTNEWDEEVGWEVGEEYEVVDPLNFTAIWRYDDPGIYFHQGIPGGEGVHIKLEYGDLYVIRPYAEYGLPVPEIDEDWAQNGFAFSHWHNGFTGEDLYPGDVIEVTGAMDAGACWQAKPNAEEVFINYHADTEKGPLDYICYPEEDGWHTVMGEVFTAPEGMAFIGWRPAEGGPRIDPGEEIQVTERIVLNAEFVPDTYTVILEANDGTGATYAYEVPYDQDFTAPSDTDGELPFPIPEGKELRGWLMLNSGDEVDPGSGIHGSGTLTLRALWIDAEADTVPLTLVGNITENGEAVSETHDIPLGAEFTLPFPYQVGHLVSVGENEVFGGWQIGETLYAENARLTITGETTATAVVVADTQLTKYQLVFSNDGTHTSRAPIEIGLGQTVVMPVNPYVAPEGMAFGGWQLGETIYQEGESVVVSAEMLALADDANELTAVAVWNEAEEITYYTVSFDAGEGSGAMSDVRVPAGSSYTLPMSGFEAPEHHTFYNWLVGEDDEYNPGDVRVISESITLTAQYGPAPTPVRYYDPETGATWEHADIDLLYGQAHKVLTPDRCYFTAPEGKVFASWAQVDDESGLAIRAIVPGSQYDEVEVTGDFCLHATWVEDASAVYKMYVKEKQDEDPIWRDTSDGGYFRTPDPDVVEIPENMEIDYWDIFDMDGELLMTAESGEYVPATCDAVFEPVFKERMVRVTYRFMLDSWATYVTGSMAAGNEHTTMRPEEIFDMPDGMIFDCWLVVDKESEEIINQINPYGPYNTIAAGDDYELVGNWVSDTDNRFVLRIDENGSPDGNPGPDSVPAGGYFMLPDSSFLEAPEGMMFDYWEVTMGEDEPFKADPGASFLATADATAKAIWKPLPVHTITYYTNDEEGGTVFTRQAKLGDEYALESLDDLLGEEFIVDNYFFDCWLEVDEPTYESVKNSYNVGDTITIEGDISFLARWIENGTPLLEMTFDLNGGRFDLDGEIVTEAPASVAYAGTHFTFLSIHGLYAPAGMEFDYWDVDGERYEYDDEVYAEENVTAKAIWKEAQTATITYYASDEPGCSVYTENANEDDSHRIKPIEELEPFGFVTPSGYRFKWWVVSASQSYEDGTGTLDPYEVVTFGDDMNLIAMWEELDLPLYRMSINLNGGKADMDGDIVDEIPDDEKYEGEYFIFPPVDSLIPPTGMKFDCWQVGADLYDPEDEIEATGNLIATAMWKAKEIRIDYEPNGSPDSWECETFDYGEEYTLRECTWEAPEGYEFDCWMHDGQRYEEGYTFVPTEDMVFTAQWKPLGFTVSYMSRWSDENATATDYTVAYGEEHEIVDFMYELPTERGMAFDHWVLKGEDGNDVSYSVGDKITVTGNIKLYPFLRTTTYLVSYMSGWNDETATATVKEVTIGEAHTVESFMYELPTERPMAFDCWVLKGEDGGETTYAEDSTITPTGDIKLYPRLKPTTYMITFTDRGENPKTVVRHVNIGEMFTVPNAEEMGFTAPQDQVIGSWTTEGQEHNKEYRFGREVEITSDLVLYPVYKNSHYTVTYKIDEAGTKTYPVTVAYGDWHTVLDNMFEAPEGKQFYEWLMPIMRDGSTDYERFEPGMELSIGMDQTFIAEWVDLDYPAYTVTFDKNGGSGEMQDEVVLNGKGLTLPDCSFTAPAGMKFDHWLIGEEIYEAGEFYVNEDESVTSVTVKAVWKDKDVLDTYEITFAPGEGGGEMAPLTATEATDFELPACTFDAPTRKSFAGWQIGDQIHAAGDKVQFTGNTTVTAVWDWTKYDVTIDPGTGNGTAYVINTSNMSFPTLEEAGFSAKEGWKFIGWFSSLMPDTLFNPGENQAVPQPITITAQWEKITYIVSVTAGEGTGEGYTENVAHGDTFVMPEFEDTDFAAPEGYAFDHWSANGDSCQPGQSVIVTGELAVFPEFVIKTYNVSINPGEGTGDAISNAATVEHGKTYTLPSVDDCLFTAPTGKEFRAWDVNGKIYDEGGKPEITEDTVVTALWQDIYFTITFKANNSTGAEKTEDVKYGTVYTLPGCTFEADENMVFDKWRIDGKGYEVNDTFEVYTDTEIMADWAKSEYTVTLSGNNEENETKTYAVKFKESFTLPACEFTPDYGKTFSHWQLVVTTPVGTETEDCEVGDVFTTVKADLTFKAIWKELGKHTVTFDKNGGSGSMTAESVYDGYEFELPDCGFTAPAGKQFAVWNVNGKDYKVGEKVTITGATTVKAVWTTEELTVSFSGGEYGTGSMADDTAYYGVAYALPQNGFAYDEDSYVFLGWQVGGTVCAPDQTVALTTDTTITAVWADRWYTVTVSDPNGSANAFSTNVEYGNAYTLETADEYGFKPDDLLKFSHFVCGGKNYNPGDKIENIKSNQTVTVVWMDVDSYTVTFDANGGSGTMAAMTAREGVAFELPGCTLTPPTGKQFKAWDVNGEEYEPGEAKVLTANTTVKAIWETADHKLTFKANNSTGAENTVDVKYGEVYTLPDCMFNADENKVFDKWRIDGVGYEVGSTYTVTGDAEIMADWAKSEYTVTLSGNNEENETKTYAVKFKESFTLPACEFTPDYGMMFSHWQLVVTTPDGTETEDCKVGDVFTTVKADLTFRAVWTELGKHAVIFDANGGSGELTEEVYNGYEFTLPAFDDTGIIEPEGKQFKAWSVNGTEYAEGDSITITGRTTVKALWTEAELAVNFLPGDCGSGTMATETAYYGVAYRLPANGFSYSTDDYVFTGWNVNGKSYGVGDTVILKADTDITAQWADRWYKVTIKDSNDSANPHVVTVEYGDSYTLKDVDFYGFTPKDERIHVFEQWTRTSDDKTFAVGDTITGIKRNMTIEAQWMFGRIVEVEVEVKDEVTGETITVIETIKEEHEVVAQPAPVDQNDEQVMNTTDPDQIPDEQLSDMLKKLQENTAPEGGTVEEAQIQTMQDVVDALHEAINGEVSEDEEPEYPVESIVVQDIIPVLEIKQNGVVVDTIKVTNPSLFPSPKGVKVSIEIPEGTDPRTHQYKITHMLTEDAWDNSGLEAGEIEVLEVDGYDLEAGTLQVWMKYFSPVAIANKEKPAEVIIPGNIDLPETGDPSSLMAWVTLLGASGIGLKAIKRRKK